ncbi:MAG: hypothetical protein FJ399_02120 [Verrucomicrobia bacterium]|nr:hypothetical protein [Verrucomicrobiota bacterium]
MSLRFAFPVLRKRAAVWMPVLFAGAVGVSVAPAAEETTFQRFVVAQQAETARPARPEPKGEIVPLQISVRVDAEAEPTPALVRMTSVATGGTVNLPGHLRRQMGWYSLPAAATVQVPVGELRIEACRGLDTEMAAATVKAEAGAANRVELKVRQFYDHAARGIRGANTHLHLRYGSSGGTSIKTKAEAEEYLRAVGRSDGLDLVYVSYLLRTGFDYVSNEFSAEELARMSEPRVRFVNGEEFRHEGGRTGNKDRKDELRYGHVLMLDLPRLVQPVSYGAIFLPERPASDALPMRRGMREARQLGATLIWCHGRQGLEDVPNWIDGVLDAQNIFDGGSEGSIERVFYPYLNAGLRIPFSTGTDWGVYDFSRVYVAMSGPAASRPFRENLRAGRSFITNGTYLEFAVDGKAAGDTVALTAPRALRVRGRGIGRDDFGGLEVVWNGEVVAKAGRRSVGGHFEAEVDAPIDVREPGWLALRIPMQHVHTDRSQYTGPGANLLGKALFAHTSPVYVTLGGRSVRQPAAVAQLVAELEAASAQIRELGAFARDAEREAVLAIYRDAIRTLQAGQ